VEGEFCADTVRLTQFLGSRRSGAGRSLRMYMHIQGFPVEIQIPAPWNLIGRIMSAPPPALPPSSILLHFFVIALLFPRGKIRRVFQ